MKWFLALISLVFLPVPALADSMSFCDGQVEIGPLADGDGALAERMADGLCWNLGRLRKLFGRRFPGTLKVRVARDMEEFRRLSHRPWSIAAVWRDGGIFTQPARSLCRVADLKTILTHELVHGFVRFACGRACPRWLEEGLAVELSGQRPAGKAPADEAALAALEKRLRSGKGSREQLQADYGACRALVRKLIKTAGLKTLTDALPRLKVGPGLLEQKLGSQSLRKNLFSR